MVFCQSCGTQFEGNVCPNCGVTTAPAAEARPIYAAPTESQPVYAAPQQPVAPPPPPYGGYQPPYGYQPTYYPPQKSDEEPISVIGWIWRFLLPYIPVVGWIIYLVMLFVWMGDTSKEESFRNFAKAQLIMMAVALGSVLVFFVLMFALWEI